MKSMTGYGRASAQLGTSTLTVQVSSVNRKTLDLTVSLPEVWETLEPMIGELVRKFASRGKVHVDLELSSVKKATESTWDEPAAAEVLARLEAFAKKQQVPFAPSADLLWQVANSQRKTTELPNADEVRPVIEQTLTTALRDFSTMRGQEGQSLLNDFLARLDLLTKYVANVAERAPQVPTYYREQFLKRLRESGLELNMDDERVLKEVAVFADRCDVSEELTRLRSHLEQFTALLKSDAEIGRKSEFILQEISREVHTIGSKANDLIISRQVIELKNELERVREQIANVE